MKASLSSAIGQLTSLGKSNNYCKTDMGPFSIPSTTCDLTCLDQPWRTSTEDVFLLHSFHGTLPTEMGNLSNLISLYVAYSQVSGTVPSELGKLSLLGK